MSKTRHLKKRNRLFKKTRKYFGGDNKKDEINTENLDSIPEKKGVFDLIGDKVTDVAEGATSFVKDKALRLIGLQPINEEQDKQNENSQQNNKIDNNVGNAISNAESTTTGLLSNVKSIGNDAANIFNQGAAAVVGNINDVLESPRVETSVTEAAKQTAQVGTNLLKKFNENLNDPEFKEVTKEALENASDYLEIGVKALNKPLDSAIDELNQSGTKAASGAVSGLIKVGMDAVGAVPGVGAIVDVGKMINDGTKAASTVVEAGSEAVETASDLFIKTNAGIKKGIQELEKKKSEAENIAKRTSDSMNEFQNPLSTNTDKVGGYAKKSKKRLFNRKIKTKKMVRFLL